MKPQSVTRQNLHYQTHPSQRAKISMITTPIGNLGDVSPRVIRALQGCDELWCEDTRTTQALLSALKLERGRLKRLDQHTSDREIQSWMKRVEEEGQWVGIVTDAGVPGISDPGAKVAAWINQFPGIRLEPVPGPSAVSAMVSIAGFAHNSFHFRGFFPRERKDALDELMRIDASPVLFFESPMRIRTTLERVLEWVGTSLVSPRFCFAKELTKLHETVYSGIGKDFIEFLLGQEFDERGEWVFSIEISKDDLKNEKTVTEWELTLECLIEAEIPTKTAAQLVSHKFKIAKNLAYQKALELQKK